MRWAPDARGRLERAAFELFSTQGYSATTIPEITARAGLTTRTFFRYFADKREVIFGGNEIADSAAHLIRSAPRDLEPMKVIEHVLDEVARTRFATDRDEVAAWRRIIDIDASLRERDARKRADLVLAARAAFLERGESELNATILAEAGALIFHVALDQWLKEPEDRRMEDTVADVIKLFDVKRAPQSSS